MKSYHRFHKQRHRGPTTSKTVLYNEPEPQSGRLHVDALTPVFVASYLAARSSSKKQISLCERKKVVLRTRGDINERAQPVRQDRHLLIVNTSKVHSWRWQVRCVFRNQLRHSTTCELSRNSFRIIFWTTRGEASEQSNLCMIVMVYDFDYMSMRVSRRRPIQHGSGSTFMQGGGTRTIISSTSSAPNASSRDYALRIQIGSSRRHRHKIRPGRHVRCIILFGYIIIHRYTPCRTPHEIRHKNTRFPLTLIRYSWDSAYTVDMHRVDGRTQPPRARGEGPASVRIVRETAPEERSAPPNLATATDAMINLRSLQDKRRLR